MKHIEIRFGNKIEPGKLEEKSFEEIFQTINPMFCFSKQVWKPQMDIFETQTEIVIQAEIAGVSKEDILIEVNDKAVKISGSRKNGLLKRTATYRLAEIQFGQFERILYLPRVIDVEKACATYHNGFLKLTLGKNIADKGCASLTFN